MAKPQRRTLESCRRQLTVERASLVEAAAESRVARAPVALDPQKVGRLSRMDALQVQAMDRAQEARRQIRIRLIDEALKRIETGDFGSCMSCGEKISPARLARDPAVPTCIDCARGA